MISIDFKDVLDYQIAVERNGKYLFNAFQRTKRAKITISALVIICKLQNFVCGYFIYRFQIINSI